MATDDGIDEDFVPERVIRASSKQKAEARGYQRAKRELRREEDEAPEVTPGQWAKRIGGVVIMGLGGLMTVACFAQWMSMRQSAKLGGLILGNAIADAVVDPTQYLINTGIFAAITYGGWRLFRAGFPKD